MQTPKVIGIFGSATTPPDAQDYAEARRLGGLLAEAGHAVISGGYGGTMRAVSQGAAERGGRVIGVTVGLFGQRGLVPNPFLTEEIHLGTLSERLHYLITRPDAYVILKGGVGTLSEMALAWSLLQVAEVAPRPLILVGDQWRAFASQFAAYSTITAHDLQYLTLVDGVIEVLPALERWWHNPPRIPPRLGDVQPPSTP